MKYFRVNEGDASGMSDFWEYFALQDTDDIDEAKALFEENNSWVFSLDCRRNRAEELTEEQYKIGLQFNRLYEYDHVRNDRRKKYNIYDTREMAEMFANRAHKSGTVRIGHFNYHNVYTINQNGEFMFRYHHWVDRIGVLV
ncbi:hypothetical protein pEaSNUABM49_00365 [Erwinia phage pEa_SNUABM_49]|nr:hypothetical protein pEaSNUABM49_00365 [Erwinia phage pEa_SNUABM_49]